MIKTKRELEKENNLFMWLIVLLTILLFISFFLSYKESSKLEQNLKDCKAKIPDELISFFELKPDFWGCDFSNPKYYTTGVFFDFDPGNCTLGNVNIKGDRR